MVSGARLRSTVVFACVLLEIGLLVSADAVRPEPRPAPVPETSPARVPRPAFDPTVERITLRPPGKPKPVVDYALTIPVLNGLADRDLERHLNADVRAFARRQVAKLTADTKRYDLGPMKLELTSRVVLLNRHVYSVEMRVITSSEMAAHPALDAFTRNYWLSDGGTVGLFDIFDGYAVRDLVARRILDDVDSSFGDVGRGALDDVVEKFTIAERGLRIVAPPCRITPCAADYATVLVEYSELRPFIDPDGPLGYRLESRR